MAAIAKVATTSKKGHKKVDCRVNLGEVAGEETGGPLKIEIGRTGLKGWDLALAGMCKGEVKRAYVPPHLAYGEKGLEGVVPPNEVIVLDIEMVAIQDRVLSFLFKSSEGTAFSG